MGKQNIKFVRARGESKIKYREGNKITRSTERVALRDKNKKKRWRYRSLIRKRERSLPAYL